MTLIAIELAIAAAFVLSAIFWGTLGRLVPILDTPKLKGRIGGPAWLALVIIIAAVGWFADFGARVGFKPDIFSSSHSSDQPKDLTLKALPAHARLSFGPYGAVPIQDGPLENVWSWTAVANYMNVQINGQIMSNTTWTISLIYDEPLLTKTISVTDKQGRSIIYNPVYADPKYAVIIIPGDLSMQTVDIKTSP